MLRHWRTEGDKAEPVFVTWLRDVGRFCVRAKYGRYSLRHGEWYVDIGAGHEPAPSPLEQPTAEALLVSEALHGRLKQPVPAWSALAFFDMDGDRRIERLARRSRVLLLWDLESYNRRLADAAAGSRQAYPLC